MFSSQEIHDNESSLFVYGNRFFVIIVYSNIFLIKLKRQQSVLLSEVIFIDLVFLFMALLLKLYQFNIEDAVLDKNEQFHKTS